MLAGLLGSAIGVMATVSLVELVIKNAMENNGYLVMASTVAGALVRGQAGAGACLVLSVAGCLLLYVWCCLVLDVWCCLLLCAACSLNPQPSTLNPQPATRNPQPATRNPQPATLNPQLACWRWREHPNIVCQHTRLTPLFPQSDVLPTGAAHT
jgi:hypothetical protein